MPSELGELALLCRAALAGQPLASLARPSEPAQARSFDEATLASLALMRNSLACECPRQLADLLLIVGSFEHYSAQCASRRGGSGLFDEFGF